MTSRVRGGLAGRSRLLTGTVLRRRINVIVTNAFVNGQDPSRKSHGDTGGVHVASRRVLEKCGLTLVRTVPYGGPDADLIDGAGQGELEYALTRTEWQAGGRTRPWTPA